MKKNSTTFVRHLRGLLHTTLLLLLVCSCKTTVSKSPSSTDSLLPSNQITYSKPKTSRRFSKKKLEDAMPDFKRDNRNGRLQLKQYGAPSSLTPYYNKLLTEELGIKIDVIAEGVISPDTLRYAKSYNALMTREIQRKYGPDILREAQRRARIIKAQSGNSSL